MTQAMQRTRVKMCGTTRIEDALAAVRFGVDALGFIFYAKSPRYVAPQQAAAIVASLPPFIDRVGVFVDAPLNEVVQLARLGLSFVQLHGSETPEYCRELRKSLPECGIVKAFRVGAETCRDTFRPHELCVDAFLLDTYVKGARGGTGLVFDWTLIDKLGLTRPLILAGGLSPENVTLAIEAVHPYAIDINSGIEVQAGIKDHQRLQALMQLVAEMRFK